MKGASQFCGAPDFSKYDDNTFALNKQDRLLFNFSQNQNFQYRILNIQYQKKSRTGT
jgi:hypothetical protein